MPRRIHRIFRLSLMSQLTQQYVVCCTGCWSLGRVPISQSEKSIRQSAPVLMICVVSFPIFSLAVFFVYFSFTLSCIT